MHVRPCIADHRLLCSNHASHLIQAHCLTETIFARINERWPEGKATLCQKVDEQWETPRPNEALLARLCTTLQLPITDRNLYSTALQQYPGDANTELVALQAAMDEAALQAAMYKEDED